MGHSAAWWTMNQLRLKNPDAIVSGMWHQDGSYVVVVHDPNGARASDGRPLSAWFREHIPSHLRMALASAPPDGWNEVEEQTIEEFTRPVSSLGSLQALLVDLCQVLPHDFPQFDVANSPVRIVVAQPLDEEQTRTAEEAWARLDLQPPCPISVEPAIVKTNFERTPRSVLTLIPSRRLPSSAGTELRCLWEEDEDCWNTFATTFRTTSTFDSRDLLPDEWKHNRSRCIVPVSAFPAKNIRNYISLYREVVLVAPLGSTFDEVRASLNLTEEEWLDLLVRGRLRMLLPQTLDRYNLPFLSKAAEAAPGSLLFSRRLALCSAAETRNRIPFLYPVLPPGERTLVVNVLAQAAKNAPQGEQRRAIQAIADELGRIYSDADHYMEEHGALGVMNAGVGSFLAAVWKALRGQDLAIEFSGAAGPVEWGALLDATVFPVESSKYSEQVISEIIAGFYSPQDPGAAGRFEPLPAELHEVLSGILSLDNSAPIRDVVDAIDGGDLDRLRNLVSMIATQNLDADSRRAAVDEFNRLVRQVERDTAKTRAWDFAGLASALGPLVLPGPGKYVGIAGWVLRGLLSRHDLGGNVSPTVGRVIDQLNAPLRANGAAAVLVARVTRRLTGKGQ